jgi:hypothetical protein
VDKELPNHSVRISVKVEGGAIVRPNGSPLPEFLDCAGLELILPLSAFRNKEDVQAFLALKSHTIAPVLGKIWLGLTPSSIPAGRSRELSSARDLGLISPYVFIEIQLQEELKLSGQLGKRPWLEPCKCLIPLLQREAQSLNHAYTIASEEFETNRISHTANVFSRAILRESKGWVSLGEIRSRFESDT